MDLAPLSSSPLTSRSLCLNLISIYFSLLTSGPPSLSDLVIVVRGKLKSEEYVGAILSRLCIPSHQHTDTADGEGGGVARCCGADRHETISAPINNISLPTIVSAFNAFKPPVVWSWTN